MGMVYVHDAMKRAQILLEEWQYDTLKALSEKRGESLSHVVREAVAMHLSAKDQPARAVALDDDFRQEGFEAVP
jgi:predicted DNA-binding protein